MIKITKDNLTILEYEIEYSIMTENIILNNYINNRRDKYFYGMNRQYMKYVDIAEYHVISKYNQSFDEDNSILKLLVDNNARVVMSTEPINTDTISSIAINDAEDKLYLLYPNKGVVNKDRYLSYIIASEIIKYTTCGMDERFNIFDDGIIKKDIVFQVTPLTKLQLSKKGILVLSNEMDLSMDSEDRVILVKYKDKLYSAKYIDDGISNNIVDFSTIEELDRNEYLCSGDIVEFEDKKWVIVNSRYGRVLNDIYNHIYTVRNIKTEEYMDVISDEVTRIQ